jgi:hypothetical protein
VSSIPNSCKTTPWAARSWSMVLGTGCTRGMGRRGPVPRNKRRVWAVANIPAPSLGSAASLLTAFIRVDAQRKESRTPYTSSG